MNAEEMFAALDMKLQRKTEKSILYGAYGPSVVFDLKYKTYTVGNWNESECGCDVTLSIDRRVHNAIHRQMEELGWI